MQLSAAKMQPGAARSRGDTEDGAGGQSRPPGLPRSVSHTGNPSPGQHWPEEGTLQGSAARVASTGLSVSFAQHTDEVVYSTPLRSSQQQGHSIGLLGRRRSVSAGTVDRFTPAVAAPVGRRSFGSIRSFANTGLQAALDANQPFSSPEVCVRRAPSVHLSAHGTVVLLLPEIDLEVDAAGCTQQPSGKGGWNWWRGGRGKRSWKRKGGQRETGTDRQMAF